MMVIDSLLVCGIMLIIEKAILKEKYILLSPFTIGQISIFYVYIMPFLFYNNTDIINYVSRININDVTRFLMIFRVFYYLFCILSIISFYKIKKRIIGKEILDIKISNSFMLISLLVLVFLIFLGQIAAVNFNIGIFIDKMFNPRKYTYFTEGLGVFTYAVEVSKTLLLYVSILYKKQKKGFLSSCIFLVSIILNVMGGSKSSMLMVLIFYLITSQKLFMKVKLIKFRDMLRYAIIILVFVIFSFMIMSVSDAGKTVYGTINRIITYSQEAYYSTKVINDYKWDFNHIITVIEALLFSAIPRKVFSSKGYYGLYQNYWKPTYEPNSVIYQTSTYGFLAEGHMMFSFLSPFIYALLLNWLFKKLYTKYYSSTKLSSFFIVCYLFTRIYFLIRTGLFMATTLWIIVIYFVASKLFFAVGNKFNTKVINQKKVIFKRKF